MGFPAFYTTYSLRCGSFFGGYRLGFLNVDLVIPKKRGTTMETIGRTRGQVGQVVKPSATNRNPEALNPGAPQNHSYPSPSVRRSPQSHEALISWLEQSETYTRPREAAQTARPESCQHHECHTPASCRCFWAPAAGPGGCRTALSVMCGSVALALSLKGLASMPVARKPRGKPLTELVTMSTL